MTKRQKSLVSSFFQFYDETTKKSVVSSFFQFYDETTKTSVVSSLFSILWRNYKKILFLSYFSKEETTKKKQLSLPPFSLDTLFVHWMQYPFIGCKRPFRHFHWIWLFYLHAFYKNESERNIYLNIDSSWHSPQL